MSKFSLKKTGVNTVTHPLFIGRGTPLTKEHTEEIPSLGWRVKVAFPHHVCHRCVKETPTQVTLFDDSVCNPYESRVGLCCSEHA